MPPLVFEIRPCRRAQLVWALFGLAAAAALGFAFTSAVGWHLSGAGLAGAAAGVWLAGAVLALAVLGTLALLGRPALAVLRARGAYAVRRVEWLPDGTWRLTRPDGRSEAAQLAGATATFGPWILLAWVIDGRTRLPRRRYALIEVSQVGPGAFRALKGRLSMLPARQSGRAGAVAP